MKKIIVPIDFSEYSEYALEAAAILAKKNNAEIFALHMLEMSSAVLTASGESQQPKMLFYLRLAEQKFQEFLNRDYLEGIKVTPIVKNFKVFSEVSESEWDNTNPSLTGFYGVIHMNGTTSTTIMPIPAQTALVDFVKNKGGHYVQAEWDGYQLTEKQMLAMRDIILLDREELNTIGLTYTVVAEQKNHPVLKDIPGSFAIANANSNGKAHVFAVSPSVVLIKEGTRDGVVVREFGKGKILGFNHAGNFSNQTTWSDTNIQKIVVNFFKWK